MVDGAGFASWPCAVDGVPPMIDAYLFEAGWLFFAAWTVVVAVVTVKAFAGDLFPSKTQPSPEACSTETHEGNARLG